MSSADAPSAAVRTMTPPCVGAISLRMSRRRVALVVLEPARDAEALAVRDEDDEAAGERDLGREPRALRLHRVLDRLDEDLLAAAQEVLDLAAVARALELGRDDLVDVEEAVLLEADLDERGLHAGEHVVDDALVDVPGDRALLGPLEVDLGDGPSSRTATRCSPTSTETRSSRFAAGSGARRGCGAAPARLLAAPSARPACAPASRPCPSRRRFFSGCSGFSALRGLRRSPGFLRPRPPRLPRRRAAGSRCRLSVGGPARLRAWCRAWSGFCLGVGRLLGGLLCFLRNQLNGKRCLLVERARMQHPRKAGGARAAERTVRKAAA